MPFVQYLELPPLPDHLISQVYQLIDDFTPPEGIPIESMPKALSKPIIERIEQEGQELNFLPKSSKLPI
jgi:hypothetical protein